MKPKLLDLFCGAGGCSMGYYRAGFDVTGVDIKPQPHYPFKFIQADALAIPIEGYDCYHASPPCKTDNQAVLCRPKIEKAREKYKRFIKPTREILLKTGLPFVIENVPLARFQLINPLMLCGTQFGLKVKRHRYFELHGFEILFAPAGCACKKSAGYTAANHGFSAFKNGAKLISVAGHNFSVSDARLAMGIDWAVQSELSQAIPPAYTEFIGKYLIQEVMRANK
jgi:DNA (cytosine-5)-methyltransferase 1